MSSAAVGVRNQALITRRCATDSGKSSLEPRRVPCLSHEDAFPPFPLAAVILAASWTPSASAQSVGRIRRSLDKATGSATAATGSGAPAAVPTTSTAAQTAANRGRCQPAQQGGWVGVEDRVVAFFASVLTTDPRTQPSTSPSAMRRGRA